MVSICLERDYVNPGFLLLHYSFFWYMVQHIGQNDVGLFELIDSFRLLDRALLQHGQVAAIPRSSQVSIHPFRHDP